MKYLMMSALLLTAIPALHGDEGVAAEEAPMETPEVKEIPAAAEAAPVEVKPFGCVAHLTDLIAFHQAEILNFKKIIQRWNDKVGAALKRKQDMEKEMLDLGRQIDELGKSDDKRSSKEIKRLLKQSKRLGKDIKAVEKELTAQGKDLAGELKIVSKESVAALKERFQNVINDVKATEN